MTHDLARRYIPAGAPSEGPQCDARKPMPWPYQNEPALACSLRPGHEGDCYNARWDQDFVRPRKPRYTGSGGGSYVERLYGRGLS